MVKIIKQKLKPFISRNLNLKGKDENKWHLTLFYIQVLIYNLEPVIVNLVFSITDPSKAIRSNHIKLSKGMPNGGPLSIAGCF